VGFTRYLLRRLGGSAGQARFVRRVTMHCPHEPDQTVEIELLMRRTGTPSMVLRCSKRSETPPACDQACRHRAEAVVGDPRGLLMIPARNLPREPR
jgi:hypothetical protein